MSIVELKSLAVVRLRVVVVREVSDLESIASVTAGRGQREACAPGALCRGWHLEQQKYGIIIMKFGHFWRIGICTADSDIFMVIHLL